ncbi:polyketide synthase dehydratase domain-containing protein, partial [Streptosporangium sp. NPDC048865]|uniref:polyketide synthase dehydratase domain-containing protein n=1 Tax=Streptosporangium sp. NPDC048865 TaxID=3155766 RepID=UPI003445F726
AFHSPLMEPMLEDFREVARTLTYSPPRIPVVSTLTGQAATDERLCSPEYWVEQVRGTVRFADGVRTLHAQGARAYLELGPDGVLSAMVGDTLGAGADVVPVPMLRKDRDEPTASLTALAELFVHGVPVDWRAVLPGGRRVDLPTYAFQHQRFWPNARQSGDARALGQAATGHPLLGAAVGLAGSDGVLLTGRLSPASHAWLADHVVAGSVVVPGSVFVELAVRAGDQVGCDLVEELSVEAPLVVGEGGAVAVQVRVGEVRESGRREVSVYGRPDGTDDVPWARYATGTLATGGSEVASFDVEVWPPVGATVIELEGLYEELAEEGLAYGPAFQGVQAAWRGAGGEVFAEVSVPEQAGGAGSFGVHPVLLDAALRMASFTGLDDAASGRVPLSWSGAQRPNVGEPTRRSATMSRARPPAQKTYLAVPGRPSV